MGDAVLAAVAGRLREVVRPDDTVARHAGDEFIVLCENLTVDADAADVAAWILDAFSRPLAVSGRRFTVDLSIGVAVADRTALPVTDSAGMLIGIVTIDGDGCRLRHPARRHRHAARQGPRGSAG